MVYFFSVFCYLKILLFTCQVHNVRLKQCQNLRMFWGCFFLSLIDKPLEANSIDSLLKLPDSKTELAAASILANMNRINQSPSSDDVESLNSSSGTENHLLKPLPPKLEETENDTEQSEEV